MQRNIHRSVRACAGVLLMLILGSIYAWSYFKVALGAAYPMWSQKQITLNFTIMMSVFCAGGLVAGNLLKNWRKSTQLLVSAFLVGAGFLGVSFLPEAPDAALWQLYICYGVLSGLGTGIAYNAVLSGILPWFPDCTGLISGVLLMGMGFGALILGNAAAALLAVCSLSETFRIFAAGAFAILILCAPLVRIPGEGERTAEPGKTSVVEANSRSYTTTEMIRRPTFWVYFCWNVLISASGMLVINSASSISVYFSLAAVIGLLVSVFNGLGRLGIGACMDRIGWKATMFVNNALLIVSGALLFVGDRADAGVVVLCGMLLIGVCYGGGITISAALIRELYGTEHYASNFAVCNLCGIPASVVGPMIAAALQDGSGGYASTFIMVMIMGVVTLCANFFIRKP